MDKKYYITTPIYYPSGKWHIGTCYTTVICDAIARFKRMQNYDVFYLTGTDEHGQKIEETAKNANIPVKQFLDTQIDGLKKVWERLDIKYDKFIRTTDEYHKATVKKIFTKLYEKGDIYKSEYEGHYCSPCESFWTKTQLVDGKCPDCGRLTNVTKESCYFFRLSKYQDKLIELIENNPDFLQPKSRQNEMLNNFLKCGLQDLAVTRTSFKWGVEVPFDSEHVVYVWIDALTNYISALGYLSDDDSMFKKFWPADIHMMGKEIVRFHSIVWPALLMALDLPLPKRVFGHGWLLLNDEKMSKSKGNVVDPMWLSEKYSVDAVRYFLLREVPFGQDGTFSNLAFFNRTNTDLCNTLGNLVSRTTAMINQYFEGILPSKNFKEEIDNELILQVNELYAKVSENLDNLLLPEALSEIMKVAQRANKYIDETTPWLLAKDESKKQRLGTVLYNLAETIRVLALMLTPFLSNTPKRILDCLSLKEYSSFENNTDFGQLAEGTLILNGAKLFERIDINKELLVTEQKAAEIKASSAPTAESKHEKETEQKANISYDDFVKVDLKIGKILTAEKVAKSDKLLKFSVDICGKTRTIVSGIAKCYTPEEMVNKNVVVVVNLAPVKLCGILSEGMILCADGKNGDIVLIEPSKLVDSGSVVR